MQNHEENSKSSPTAEETTAMGVITSALADLCARERTPAPTPISDDMTPPVPALTSTVWDEVARVAKEEWVAPLLHQAWNTGEDVPAAISTQFYRAHLLTAMVNLLRFDELRIALDRLSTAGIQIIVLKGAALATTVYTDIALRPMRDVDLLIHRADVPEAVSILKSLGYATTEVEVHDGAILAYENEIGLVKPGRSPTLLPRVRVELHWSLLDSPFHQRLFEVDWLWATARPLEINGAPTQMLGAEAQLLHLCAHLWLHHQGEGMLWRHDIAAMIYHDQEEIDWDEVLTRARDLHMVLPLQHTLPMVVESWNAPVPAPVLERLRTMTAVPAERRVFNWLTAESRPPAQRFWADLWGQPDWGRRVAFAMRQLFPTPEYMHQRYQTESKWTLLIYYIYRWLLGLVDIVAPKSRYPDKTDR